MTSYERIDAVCRRLGWTCADEVFRYANGRHVGLTTLRAAMPKEISLDDLRYAEDRMWAEIMRLRDPKESARAFAAIKRWNKANPPAKRRQRDH